MLALTNDDEVNLAVTMAAALLRPELPVIARTVSPAIEDRMHAFGTPSVVNPFDRFGDHLRLALRAPASYQLLTWLESGPGRGTADSAAGRRPHGRWVMCGYGRFGREMTQDLRAEGLEVTIIEPLRARPSQPTRTSSSATPPSRAVLARADLGRAVGLRRRHRQRHHQPVAGRGRPADQPEAVRRGPAEPAGQRAVVRGDATSIRCWCPTEVVAHEVYAQLSTPLLWRFLQEMPRREDDWAAAVVGRMTQLCGGHLQELWKVRLTATEAPALRAWLARAGPGWGTCCATPTTATSLCTWSRCCCAAG